MTALTHATLKAKQRLFREDFPENMGIRVHRSLSWLCCAEQSEENKDGQFIYLWIAFNAAYGQESEQLGYSESKLYTFFMQNLVKLDKEDVIYNLLWEKYSSQIRLLLDNEFIDQTFWDFQNGQVTEDYWVKNFANEKKKSHNALANHETAKVLGILLRRLYTLRNQLMHGGATWNGQVNRPQVKDAAKIMSELVPIIIDIMLDNPQAFPGKPSYPLIGKFDPTIEKTSRTG